MQPLLVEAGEILEAAGQNHDLLCDGRLATDNVAMAELPIRVRAITPPADAAAIHDLVLRSGDACTEALNNIQLFCDTENQL